MEESLLSKTQLRIVGLGFSKLRPAWGAKLLLILAFTLFTFASAQKLTVLVHDSFAISDEIIADFTKQTGIELEFLAAGDAGQILNKAILTQKSPLADVLYGIDNSLLARAQLFNIFEPYKSANLKLVPANYIFDTTNTVTPVDVGYVNFNLDLEYFAKNNLELPQDILELNQEKYQGLTVVEHPATSSPGLAFMLATIARFGETGDYTWLDYWYELKNNDLLVSNGWSDAYYNAFSRYGGDRAVVLSYSTSPAAEVIFAEEKLDSAPTANLYCEKCVYEQIEAVGILKSTPKLKQAQQFIDFMLSKGFQEDIPLNMFVYPVNENAAIPKEFELYSKKPTSEQIAKLDSEYIEEHLRTWLRDWTAVVEQGRKP
ncbi:MAG TPA: thiamine ABC transporter substrate-binding protein [Trueperaceae bacterium]|nr:thiamine ABC transporter substrate-binding protein [Trueperaceae bacterium]